MRKQGFEGTRKCPPGSIWTLHQLNKYGHTTMRFVNELLPWQQLVEYVRVHWYDEFFDLMPEDEEDAVKTYFERVDESYEITPGLADGTFSAEIFDRVVEYITYDHEYDHGGEGGFA